jgi:hypothetical protein
MRAARFPDASRIKNKGRRVRFLRGATGDKTKGAARYVSIVPDSQYSGCADWLSAAGLDRADAYFLSYWDKPGQGRPAQIERYRREFASIVALVPPAFILAFGSALVWAFKGFG